MPEKFVGVVASRIGNDVAVTTYVYRMQPGGVEAAQGPACSLSTFANQPGDSFETLRGCVPIHFAVRHIDHAVACSDAVGQLELAGTRTGRAPLMHAPAFRIVLENAGVAISVGDKDASARSECNVRRTPKAGRFQT